MSKIRKVQVLFHPKGIWARGTNYRVEDNVYYEQQRQALAKKGLPDIVTVYEKEYPKDVATKTIWNDVRSNMKSEFYMLFYPSAVKRTMVEATVYTPEEALQHQSWHIRNRMMTHPEQYIFNHKNGKWVISPKGYIEQTEALGGEMQVALGQELAKGEPALEYFMQNVKDKQITVPLYVYPDKYSLEVRALFILVISFY